jgi:hypothetical protein
MQESSIRPNFQQSRLLTKKLIGKNTGKKMPARNGHSIGLSIDETNHS